MNELLTILLSTDGLLLLGAWFFISIFAIVFGGSMFFSVPFIQWMFPGASFGTVVWNLKVGSFFRGIGSSYTTRHQIDYKKNFQVWVLAFIGTLVWASLISQLDQRWIFPAVVIAVLLAIFAPKIAKKINQKTFHIASFLTGIYAGVFWAGLWILLVALLRTCYTQDTEIALVKIQARFLEFTLVLSAVIAHMFHGNILMSIWLPWSIGALLGWAIWWKLLHSLWKLSGDTQKIVLYTSFALAIWVAGWRFLQSF